MAKVLFTWELGAGLGHVTRMRPVVEGLCRRGHSLYLALRDLSVVGQVFRGLHVSYLQAPFKLGRPRNLIWPPHTYPHILHNIGFAEASELRCMCEAWRQLYDFIQPDLIVFDHSPTALVAARGFPARRVVLGNGFFCPPDASPYPDLRPGVQSDPARRLADEQRTLATINEVLSTRDEQPMSRVADLYRDVDAQLFATFEELDHFGPRPGVRYWGCWPLYRGEDARWPSAAGTKVFAYLRPSPCLPQLLPTLNRWGLPTIVYGSWVDEAVQERYASQTLSLAPRPLDLRTVVADCDLAILNGTHGTTASMLLAGVPVLQLPIHLEQRLTADNVAKLGAGLLASRNDFDQVQRQLERMVNDKSYQSSASQFATRYAGLNPSHELETMIEKIDRLIPRRDRGRPLPSPPALTVHSPKQSVKCP